MIESIGIGGATERADRKAKQAGSRFSEMFVDASRLRSLIAGVSAMGAAYLWVATNSEECKPTKRRQQHSVVSLA